MRRLARYHEDLLTKIYEGAPWGGSDKVDTTWPLFLLLAVFAAFDIGLGLENPNRLYLLAVLTAPGVIWFGYVQFHEIKALWIWLKQRKAMKETTTDV